jgi:hypothetical protein
MVAIILTLLRRPEAVAEAPICKFSIGCEAEREFKPCEKVLNGTSAPVRP